MYGFAHIENVYKQKEQKSLYKAVIEELSLHIFDLENPRDNEEFEIEYKRIQNKYPELTKEEQKLATLTLWWNSENGFGNASFRFLFYQFLETKKIPKFDIDGEKIYFDRNPFHRIDLQILERNPKLWEILKSFHPPGEAMVSFDSQKIRFQERGRNQSKTHKSTEPVFTKRHRDIYKKNEIEIDRKQAMLIRQHPEAISLGWVMFSNDEKIYKLIEKYLGVEKYNFGSVEDKELNKIIDKYWRAPLNGFVIWDTHTIHYEGNPDEDRKFKNLDKTNYDKFSNRICIGTNQPISLSRKALYQLAYLSEHGFQPVIYGNHNKNTNVSINIVDSKTTMWKHPRQMSENEKIELKEAKDDYDNVEDFVDNLPDIVKEFYGIY